MDKPDKVHSLESFILHRNTEHAYRKRSNKRPLSNKHLLSNKRPPYAVKLVLNAPL